MTITKQRVEEIISRIEMYGHGAGYTADEVYDLAVLALNLSNIANLKRYELDMDGCDSFGQDCGADMPEFDGPTPITPEAIENAIEYIRSIAFHIDEDDYHGKHIAYFMRQALVWLEGHSCSDDRQGKAENQPVRGNQAAESNRGNEWTGNPDIDNAIIMLDRIDTLESCDDDRIEAVKTVLRRLAGNSPVTPDGWVMVPKELTPEMMRAVQIRSELGGYATSNLSGAYNMFSEFWNVAVSAAPKVDDL